MNAVSALEWRYATKKFDAARKIAPNDLEAIWESLRLAPSSFGLQPWKFLVVTEPKIREELVKFSWNQRQVAEASHLVVLCAPKKFDAADVKRFVESIAKTRGIPAESLKGYEDMMTGFLSRLTPQALSDWMDRQIYIALGFLMYACAERRIDSCPMEGFDSAQYGKILGLDEKGLRAVVLCPIGYRAGDDKYADLKKVRYDRQEIFSFIS